MTWNLKEAEKTPGWRNFFNRIFFHNNQAEYPGTTCLITSKEIRHY